MSRRTLELTDQELWMLRQATAAVARDPSILPINYKPRTPAKWIKLSEYILGYALRTTGKPRLARKAKS